MLVRGACRGLGTGFACFVRPAQLQVEDNGGKEVRDGEEMQRRLGTPISEFTIALTMLEINGVIRSLGANQWTLA